MCQDCWAEARDEIPHWRELIRHPEVRDLAGSIILYSQIQGGTAIGSAYHIFENWNIGHDMPPGGEDPIVGEHDGPGYELLRAAWNRAPADHRAVAMALADAQRYPQWFTLES